MGKFKDQHLQMKTDIIKDLLREEIAEHRPLVLNACENEMRAFQRYLQQRKDNLMRLPLERLKMAHRGLERKAA